ncbi:MAG: phosphatidylserine decarboxylase [Desulfotignum sp.]|nr:phosphatidylserine decarboxylase [Desulfotignum sp.]MCF8086776.1 phosphatidylserine decarboxylase [Desulfotignum sp.]MCF8138580.1 phosphatidylserine decarboxylase [Desulfotignum sp.]
MNPGTHQYVDRHTGRVHTETLVADQTIAFLYATVRENAPAMFNLLISARMSALLGFLCFDLPLNTRIPDPGRFLSQRGIPSREIFGPVNQLDTFRRFFERKLRYWECRPMTDDPGAFVSPADARILPGSFTDTLYLCIKDKLFQYEELTGMDRPWHRTFRDGEYAVFRLTPDKYHYTHAPVSGRVKDVYEINGCFHSCNPGAVVQTITPFSKNRRVVTVIDTDVPDGTGVGLVAMVEIVALMIGRIVACYSPVRYEPIRAVQPGMFIQQGQPKSLFRPGSSTVVLLFEKNRVRFSPDLLANTRRFDVKSRFSSRFGVPLVETDVNVRETIGKAV